jgi:hypothetical protein
MSGDDQYETYDCIHHEADGHKQCNVIADEPPHPQERVDGEGHH